MKSTGGDCYDANGKYFINNELGNNFKIVLQLFSGLR